MVIAREHLLADPWVTVVVGSALVASMESSTRASHDARSNTSGRNVDLTTRAILRDVSAVWT
ncbi:MAG TPA: hypothetical protein VHN14_14065 [Kofleriaceae bacterium]|jgi:hypothetical protein|nr:hypothetical protein [Kofleriaceae bacterium]